MLTATDFEDRKKTYFYDDCLNLNRLQESKDGDDVNDIITDYVNNYLGKPWYKVLNVKSGDIYGNDFNDSNSTKLVTTYEYDANGNKKYE